MIKILIADDHAIVRQGLKQIVVDSPDITVTGEALHTIQWNCLLTGVSAGSAAF